MAEPTVSVVIPAARAASTIGATLDSAQAQDSEAIVDIVVAAADEATAAAARRPGVTVVDNPTGRTPIGLNRAIAAARGEILVRVDAHSVIPPGYVSKAVETLLETGAANVGGMQVPVGDSFWSRAIAAAMTSPAGAGDARYRIGGEAGPVETVYLGTYRRSTLEALGGFDESFRRHQDYELNERIRRSGGVVWFEPDLKVRYRPRSSLAALARQYFEYGSWKRAFTRSNPGSLLPRQIAPPLLVVVLGVSLGLALLDPVFWLLPAAYLAGLVGASVLTLPRSRGSVLGVPVALATMHLSWGLGFLLGQTRER